MITIPKETAKHTLRSMLENARQGFHNGSKPPFGFKVKVIRLEGRKDAKKILEIDLEEAEVVRQMFRLYPETSNGVKGVAAYLNERNILRRTEERAVGYFEAVQQAVSTTVGQGNRIKG